MAENAEQKRLFTAALQKQCGDEDKDVRSSSRAQV